MALRVAIGYSTAVQLCTNRLSITVLHNLIVDDTWSDIRVAGF